MIKISKEANPNYLCKIVALDKLRKHSNADRLQIATIDFQDVVTGLDAKEGDVYVYFPVEGKINKDFLSYTNSFRKKELNQDPEKAGFFEENCRVKAVKLRSERSMGYIVPIKEILNWAYGHSQIDYKNYIGQEFDTINNIKLVEKYEIKKNKPRVKSGKRPQLSRLIEGQVHLHTDTENLRKNMHQINPEDDITITYKTHGTSFWVANVLVKRKLNWFERVLKWFGVNISDTEYDHVYGSRRVVKNQSFEDPKGKDHFYGYDLWEDIKNQIGDIPKGFTLYGECLGYTKDGGYIQKNYDYSCELGKFRLEIYRVTYTNRDGLVHELNYQQICDFCDRLGLLTSHLLFEGQANDYHNLTSDKDLRDWREEFIKKLEEEHLETRCFMCKNDVWAEGIVLRKEKLFGFEAYKLKCFNFLEAESRQLDSGEADMESEN